MINGYIAPQCDRGQASYRNIKLRPLACGPATAT